MCFFRLPRPRCAPRPALVALASLALAGCSASAPTVARVKADPPPVSSVSPAPDPAVAKARADQMQADRLAIEGECQRAAGGSWDAWERATSPYRKALRKNIAAVPVVLRQKGGAPAQELDIAVSLDASQHARAVVAASQWLRKRGIDLIFVPVPRKAEVYAENFLDPCPTDGIIAPHVRRTLLSLMEQNVEVVDVFPALRAERSRPLYNATDPHWSADGAGVAAKLLAGRLRRYGDTSGILLIGNSFTPPLHERLDAEMGRVRCIWRGGHTVEMFADFLREPELLAGVRVVAWVATWQAGGQLGDMPAPILALEPKP
jgi:SGNH hydrolase-like domain, acetyltransferase AlgX